MTNKTSQIDTEPTLILRESGFQIEVVCPKCREVIGKFPDRRAAFCNAGSLGQHVQNCKVENAAA